jgi:hypothetical protein
MLAVTRVLLRKRLAFSTAMMAAGAIAYAHQACAAQLAEAGQRAAVTRADDKAPWLSLTAPGRHGRSPS